MRSKLVLAALITLFTGPVFAQVQPAVKISGLPLGVGAGLSDYSLDFGPGRRMIGASAWADYNLFHGLGIEVQGQYVDWDRPTVLTRMKQEAIKGGVVYRTRPFLGIRPYVKGLGGLAKIQFPSRNPLYTEDDFAMYAVGGGAEYKVWKTLFARVDYEYQFWPNVFGPKTLDPNGYTFGATYYMRGIHRHY